MGTDLFSYSKPPQLSGFAQPILRSKIDGALLEKRLRLTSYGRKHAQFELDRCAQSPRIAGAFVGAHFDLQGDDAKGGAGCNHRQVVVERFVNEWLGPGREHCAQFLEEVLRRVAVRTGVDALRGGEAIAGQLQDKFVIL